MFRNVAGTASLWSINGSGIMVGGSASTIDSGSTLTAATGTAGSGTLRTVPVGLMVVPVAGTTMKILYAS